MSGTFALAWRQLRRDLRAGEVRILIAAVVLAVLSVTAVGFVTDRANRALVIEANRLLGGDAVVQGDGPPSQAIVDAAHAPGLRVAETRELTTMASVGEGDAQRLKLADLRALGEGFPLRGEFRLVDARGAEQSTRAIPAAGTAWLTRNGAQALGAHVGDAVTLGDATFRIAAVVAQEPDASTDLFNIAPRVLINLGDLPRTALVQVGSRLEYRLVVAGDAGAVERFTAVAKAALGRGQRLETIGNARPEVRSALDRAGRFLGLAAMVSVMLAAVAVAMAARRHSERHRAGAAVMRCLGASQRRIVAINVGELLLLGVGASVLGVVLAFAMQWGVGLWLAHKLALSIPPAGPLPALQGLLLGLVVLIAFGAPPVLALRRVSALRVLRRDLDPVEPSALVVGALGIAALGALLWWKAGSATLGLAMLGGVVATLAVLALLAGLLILAVRALRTRMRGPLRYGLANVSRRAGTSVAQVCALGLGLMALLLLTFVRTDLLDRWQHSLSTDVPNRFVINVQDEQVADVGSFIRAQGLGAPELVPMIRARLTGRNGRVVTAANYRDEDARHLAEREFNLSVSARPGAGNRIVAGQWWRGTPASPELSVEQRFAERLGWKIGDRIIFDVAGQPFRARVTSLREVDWESFRPNFFVVASPHALDGYAASWITAMRVPATQPRFTARLVDRFPNLTVIDIDAVLAQVRATGDQVSTVVQVVFWFALAAGVLVLLAAVTASQDERLLEGGVMRVLGARRGQLRLAQASEFIAIGLLSGLVAAVAASVLSGVVAVRVFDLPWAFDWKPPAVGALVGTFGALAAGLWATRRVLDAPPSTTLRELQD
ncbi:ABC transporter permease [Cognatilysobacter lacus]|uniref:FtsX-like permease family protein n=1 Tax=Cognatilysobacter lacus TaxID=1643323 RepID=A0A5D8Z871_9GAMM|nr:FtsX-like permease family protein [Lysobacter lacus]TZF90283.1 FtsX-like permease family protein [Lysobacter lacus]